MYSNFNKLSRIVSIHPIYMGNQILSYHVYSYLDKYSNDFFNHTLPLSYDYIRRNVNYGHVRLLQKYPNRSKRSTPTYIAYEVKDVL